MPGARGHHPVPSFEEYVDSGGSPELDKVLGKQKLGAEIPSQTDEPKNSWTIEELVRVGYKAGAEILPSFVFTDEMVQEGAERVRQQLESEFGTPDVND